MNGQNKKLSLRALKKKIKPLLVLDDFDDCIASLEEYSPRQVINPLISCFCESDELVRWRAVSASGTIISNMAEKNIEVARIVMRRLMWTLNDESGGIGWGAPEAMGEAMNLNHRLATEYSRMLVSYSREDGNFLEHGMLQRGVLWGVLRLSEKRPEMAVRATESARGYLNSEDSVKRGLSAIIAGLLIDKEALTMLHDLTIDNSEITVYRNYKLENFCVKDLALKSLIKIKSYK